MSEAATTLCKHGEDKGTCIDCLMDLIKRLMPVDKKGDVPQEVFDAWDCYVEACTKAGKSHRLKGGGK